MKKIILLTLILVSGLLLTVACSGGGHSGYGKDNELIYELKVNKDGGIDAKSFSGITVSADKDTFANNNITVYLTEEKSTTGETAYSRLLPNVTVFGLLLVME